MKFPQGIVVELVNPNTTARYADFKHGNERYVVGSADQPFEVEVTVPASLLAKYPVISGRLSLDGQSVNYTKYVKASDLSGWARTSLCMRFTGFETGWLQSANDISPLRVRTVSNLLRPCQPTQHSLERLVQVVCEVVEEVDRASPSSAGPSCSDLVTLKAAEGTKWYESPSLSAKQGKVVGRPWEYLTQQYTYVKHLQECTLHMETAAVLLLRKVLDPAVPAHKVIIDQSDAASQQEVTQHQAMPHFKPGSPANNTRAGKKRGPQHRLVNNGNPETLPQDVATTARSTASPDQLQEDADITDAPRGTQQIECIDLT